MRRLSGLMSISGALLIAACSTRMASTSTSPMPAADAAAIRAVFDTTAAGWNRGDLSAYLFAYAPSATAMGRTGLVHGPSGIEQQMREGFWKSGRPLQQLRYDHLEIRPLGGDHALATGQYILSGAGMPDRTGWFTTIWERTGAGWRMIHDHS
jgi:ketosteroid isomerase-like protein